MVLRMRRGLASIASASLLAGLLGLAAPASAEPELGCKVIPELVGQFLRRHVSHRRLTDELRARTAELYLERIDPSKTLLLESEAAAFAREIPAVFDDAASGDCHRLSEIHATLVERYGQFEKSVRTVVSAEGFAVDPDAELVIDPDERGRPKSAQEQRDLLRRQIDFQLANYLSAGTELPEARERLVHRYELFTKHARELAPEELHATFLDAFAAALDPHSSYFSADANEDFKIAMSLSLEGIGVALSSKDGYSLVERVLPGGAADRQGSLRPNDRIISVAQAEGPWVDVIDMPLRDVVRRIRGKRGTPVRLSVLRDGKPAERFEVTIVRDTIDLEEQAASLRFETLPGPDGSTKLGVLELTSFYGDKDPTKRQCADDVARLLEQARREKADGLVLDLSRNGGGLLDYAVEISGYFIRKGPIVAVRDRSGPLQVLEDPGDDVRWSGPVVVLVSRASASASEILAGALKDYGRAVIVGDDHTFGKGTVQTVVELPGRLGALKMTTALFFRPGGLSTQRSGVASDIVIPSLLNTARFGEAVEANALANEQVRPFVDGHASASNPSAPWSPLDAPTLTKLAERSQSRVGESEAFRAIERELAEDASRGGVVRVAEILKDTQGSVAKTSGAPGAAIEGQLASAGTGAIEAPGAKSGEDEKPTPQVEEALRILGDLVALQRSDP
jgi:carboxyl-terminal processing protease